MIAPKKGYFDAYAALRDMQLQCEIKKFHKKYGLIPTDEMVHVSQVIYSRAREFLLDSGQEEKIKGLPEKLEW